MKNKLLSTLGFLFVIGISTCYAQKQSGLIDGTGKIIIPFEYDDIELPIDSSLTVKRKGFYGRMDFDGKILVPCEYDLIWSHGNTEGMVHVELDNKHGFVDITTGELVIPCIYKDASDFHDGLAIIRKSSRYGYIDKTGKLIAFGIYEHLKDFHNGYAQVEKNGKWGFIDKEGNEVIKCKYDDDSDVGSFNDSGIAWFRTGEFGNKKYGFINTNGEEIVPCIYDGVEMFNATIAVKKDGKWGFLDAEGKEITKPQYDEIKLEDRSNPYFLVKKGQQYGYVNLAGKELIPCEYDFFYYHSGIVKVGKNHKQGIYDLKSEKMITQCIYDEAYGFVGKKYIAVVKKNGVKFYLDAKGKEHKYKYKGKEQEYKNRAVGVTGDGNFPHEKYGLKDANGNLIVGYIYDNMSKETENLFIVRKNGKAGIINDNGSVVVPLIYESLYYCAESKREEGRFLARKAMR